MRVITMIMMMMIVAIAVPECGAVSDFTLNENDNNNAVVSAMPPVFAVGRAKQWHRLNNDEKIEVAELMLDRHEQKQLKQRRWRQGASCFLILITSLLIDPMFSMLGGIAMSVQWIPEFDKNGNRWSEEQHAILQELATCIENGDARRAQVRLFAICIEAVAGSGKTTVLEGACELIASAYDTDHIKYGFSLTLVAFNRTIADVLKGVLKSNKPDGADWDMPGSGTLNSHGHRSVLKWLNEEHQFPFKISLSDGKYTDIAGVVLADLLSQPDLFKDWHDNLPVKGGFKQESTGYFALRRLLSNGALKAMGNGMCIGNSGFDFDEFIAANGSSLNLSDAPIGSVWMANLEMAWARIIADGQFIIENPQEELRPCDMGVIMSKHQSQYPQLHQVSELTDAQLVEAGALVSAMVGRGVATDGDSKQLQVLPYGSRLQLVYDGRGTCYNGILKSLSGFDDNYGGRVGQGYVAIGGSRERTRNPRTLKLMAQVDGWQWSIKDDPEVISAFIDRCKKHMDVDFSYAFGDDVESDDNGSQIEDSYTIRMGFIDQIYTPAYFGLSAWRTFDILFCDEVQDLSVLQGSMLKKLSHDATSVVLVGDRNQSLYLFSGASSEAMTINAEAFGCVEMPMTVCFRGTHQIAQEVQDLMGCDADGNLTNYAKHTSPKWIPSWPQGEVSTATTPQNGVSMVEAGDMVLSRISAPLASMAMKVLARGIPVRLGGGGSMENRVRSLAKRLDIGKGNFTNGAVENRIEAYLHNDQKGAPKGVLTRLLSKYRNDRTSAMKDQKYQEAVDNCEAIKALYRGYTSNGQGDMPFSIKQSDNTDDENPVVVASNDYLGTLFGSTADDTSNLAIFATIHRAKGLESDRVFIITDRLTEDENGEEQVSPCFMLPWSMSTSAEREQERNAVYVAITRAKSNNVYLSNRGSDAKSALWMLDLYPATDALDAPVDDSDDDEDLPVFTEEAIIESEFEEEVLEYIHAILDEDTIEDAQEPQTDEVVQSTTDTVEEPQDEPMTTPVPDHAFLFMVRDIDENYQCVGMSDDPIRAQAWLDTVAQDGIPEGYKGAQFIEAVEEEEEWADVALVATWMNPFDEIFKEAFDAKFNAPQATTDDEAIDGEQDQVEQVATPPSFAIEPTSKKRTRKSMDDRVADLITVVSAHTLEHPLDPLSGKDVADRAGMSMSTLRRVLDHIEALHADDDERAHCDYAVFGDELNELDGQNLWVTMFYDCGEDLEDQLMVQCERTESGRYRTLDFFFAWDINDTTPSTTDGGDDEIPDQWNNDPEVHQTGYAIDDDPEGKYKDNERYKCPHPNCDGNFNETAVRVEGGQDFCEHVMCTWVEHNGCTDCGVHVDADCICDEPQLRLEDLNREQLLAIVNGLEDRDEYIKQELLEIGGNMADNAHYVMVGIKEAPVEGNEDIEEHIKTWHFADGDKSEEDIINECIDNISSTYKVNYHTIQLIKYMGTSHDRGMGKYKSIVFTHTFDEDTDDDQDDDDGGHTTDGGDDDGGNDTGDFEIICSRMIGDEVVVFEDGCDFRDDGTCMNCGQCMTTQHTPHVGLLESLFLNDDVHTGHHVSDATVSNYANLAKKWDAEIRMEVVMDAPIKDFVIQSRMVDNSHVAMISIGANQGNSMTIDTEVFDDVVVLQDDVQAYSNGRQNFMHQLLMKNGIKGIDKGDAPTFSMNHMQGVRIPTVTFMGGKGKATTHLSSMTTDSAGDLHAPNNFTLKMPDLKQLFTESNTTMVQSFTERELRGLIDLASKSIEVEEWHQCTDEDGNELKGEYEAKKVKRGRASSVSRANSLIIGNGLYDVSTVHTIVRIMCASTKGGKGKQTVQVVSARDAPLVIIGEDWRTYVAPRVNQDTTESKMFGNGELMPDIDLHTLTEKHVALHGDKKSLQIVQEYNDAITTLRSHVREGDE